MAFAIAMAGGAAAAPQGGEAASALQASPASATSAASAASTSSTSSTASAASPTSPASATFPSSPATGPAALLDLTVAPIVLLGEVHDNAGQHAMRLDAFRALLASGARPALLMEQLDRERQPTIDAARAAPGASAAEVFAAGSPNGWNAAFYTPFVELALRYGLPIVAANVSRAEARRVMQRGLSAEGFDAAVPKRIEAAHARDIQASHCGMIDRAAANRMAQAQIARDQFMARVIEENRSRGAVLLAGNGHVRNDVGVPRWLAPATRARSRSIGLLEAGDDSGSAFDFALTTPRQPREDPCASFRPAASAPRP